MKKNFLFIVIAILISLLSFGQYSDVKNFNPSELIFDTIQGYDLVYFDDCGFTDEIGAPMMSIIVLKYLLPINAEVTGITMNNKTDQVLSGSYDIYPAQPEYLPNGMEPPEFVEPDSIIYNSSEPYPENQIEIADDGFMMAHHIVSIRIFPLVFLPAQHQLKLSTSVNFTIEYTLGEVLIQLPQRISFYRNQLTEGFIKSQIENPEDYGSDGGGAKEVVDNNTGEESLDIDFLPTLYDDIPDYIIITNELLKPEFQILADWKTKKGIPTLIVTTEEIYSEYTGIDEAEQIRKYLIDAYINWGPSLFILLGGDVDIIPARYGYPMSGEGIHVTDLYYATVEGNWNADGDYLWGEDNEWDESPDLHLGRAPVETIEETNTFVNKVTTYEKMLNIPPSGKDYVSHYLATNWVQNREVDQCIIYQDIMNYWPDKYFLWYQEEVQSTCNEDAIVSRALFLEALNEGLSNIDKFHLILHSDHSGPNSMGTGAWDSDQWVFPVDLTELSNAPYYQVMISTGCNTHNFQYNDCVAEYYINAVEGGAVAFLGYTIGGKEPHLPSPKKYFSSLFEYGGYSGDCYKNGIASNNAKLSGAERALRGLNLLGDPEMPVWTKIPDENGSNPIIVSSLPLQVYTGINSIGFIITGSEPPLEINTVDVCLYKKNSNGEIEVYETKKVNVDENATIETIIDTPGDLYLTVTTHNYLPVEKTITVVINPGLHIFASNYLINDASGGNGDSEPNAGEEVVFALQLTNQGTLSASNVSAGFSPGDSEIIDESYEGVFPPLNWEMNSSASLEWQQADQTIVPAGFDPPDGSHLAYCNTSQNNTNNLESRLFTPVIYFKQSVLKFSMFHVSDNSAGDCLKLQINTGGTWTDIPGQQFPVYNAQGNLWIEHEIDLSNYNGIYGKLGFLAVSSEDYDIHIDQASISSNFIDPVSNPCNYGFDVIQSGGSDWCNNYCTFLIDPNTPDAIIVPFDVEISATGGYYSSDKIFVQVGASELTLDHIEFLTSLGNDQTIGPNEDIFVTTTLYNEGNTEAVEVTGVMTVIEPSVKLSII